MIDKKQPIVHVCGGGSYSAMCEEQEKMELIKELKAARKVVDAARNLKPRKSISIVMALKEYDKERGDNGD